MRSKDKECCRDYSMELVRNKSLLADREVLVAHVQAEILIFDFETAQLVQKIEYTDGGVFSQVGTNIHGIVATFGHLHLFFDPTTCKWIDICSGVKARSMRASNSQMNFDPPFTSYNLDY